MTDTQDPLDQEIAKARAECGYAREQRDAWITKVAIAEAKLAGLERAAELRPARAMVMRVPHHAQKAPASISEPNAHKGGRQLGAISKIWRGIMQDMAIRHPAGASDQQITTIAQAHGLSNIRPRDARRQMEKYLELDFVSRAGTGVVNEWQITEAACQKFNFD
ncbi:MAG: hypothetical protein ACREFQ_21170, partial [Stellaceae bacterium]